jgi:hypothetical protein
MRKILIALTAAAGLLTFGASAAQASVHHNRPEATPACSGNCFDLSSLQLGTSMIQNAYVPGDKGVGGKVGQDVNLKQASNTHPNEDFTGAQVGNVSDFCGQTPGFPVTSYVCLHYSDWPVFEANWSPFGNQSGLCAGVSVAGLNGENVTLQSCGASNRTLWIGDDGQATSSGGYDYVPWISGSDTQFSHPLVLTVDPTTSKPGNQLKNERENLLTGGVTADSQQFALSWGPAA